MLGASKGIGRGVAAAFAQAGARVIMCSRTASDIEKAADEIRQSGGKDVLAIACDISTEVGVRDLLQKLGCCQNTSQSEPKTESKIDRMTDGNIDGKIDGKIDILVNNIAGPSPSASVDTKVDAWRSGFEQLFLSSTLLTQALLPMMIQRRYGRIMTVTSLSVVEPIDHLAVSTSMRAAVTAYCKSLAKEVAPHGVTVHTLMPGIIYTDRIVNLRKATAARQGTTLDQELEKTLAQIPAGRFGEPSDVGHLAAFLASPLAGFLTGLNIPIDGGQRKGWT